MAFIELPLHDGRAPKWLFNRMVRLGAKIINIIVDEYGERELIRRIGHPLWFHALALVLGFDWDSSGVTTVTSAVLKKCIRELDLDIMVVGGKGKAALNIPSEIKEEGERLNFRTGIIESLSKLSRIAAKVDTSLIQAGYPLYHQAIFCTKSGEWCIVQQGMNVSIRMARRYHWTWNSFTTPEENPHSGLLGYRVHDAVLNLTSAKSRDARRTVLDLAKENPRKIRRLLQEACGLLKGSILEWLGIKESIRRSVLAYRIDPRKVNWKALEKTYQIQPRNYEEFLLVKGLGPTTIRALALISEIIYGDEVDWSDPLRYGYAFGGKDGIPYPVDVKLMDEVGDLLDKAIADKEKRERLLKRIKGILRRGNKVYYLVKFR
ncbi:MAG: DUF763 domain-containing protein [Thermoprotei archaeon]|nr:MAG: DUF763 domain-containing protein [Thermoprotei archaeon]